MCPGDRRRPATQNNFHNALYVLMTLIGLNARAEVHTSDGRIDLLVETPAYVYIIELKHNGTAEQALRQIEVKVRGSRSGRLRGGSRGI